MTALDRKQQQKIINFWIESADRNWKSAQTIFESKNYDWSLFIAQLAVEKLLKALVSKREKTPPQTHNLVYLINLTEISITKIQLDWLKEFQKWNIAARYDEEKFKLYKLATREYTTKWLERVKEIIQWLKKQLD